ncbi:MAG: hypothetical protein NTY47_02620 [Candidatus Omnitrophica bacterium]|nr:hypothetical protein [Candidatus Omnitrophota bacterium]
MSKNKFKIKFVFLMIFTLTVCVYAFAQDAPAYNYDPQGRRDPFVPIVTRDGRLIKVQSEGTATGLALEGIILDANGISCAIINSDVVRIGDKVNEYEVLKIENNKVILIKNGEPLEIELNKEER